MKTTLSSISFIAALALSPLAAFAADEVTPGKASTTTAVPEPAAPTAPAGNGGTVTVPDTAPDKSQGKASTATDVPVPKDPAGEKKAEDKATEPAKDANK